MEIITHLVRDLNRFLDLRLQVIIDADSILLFSFGTSKFLREYSTECTLDLYNDLIELKQMIVSWSNHYFSDRTFVRAKIETQISIKYNFDISKHYKIQKLR